MPPMDALCCTQVKELCTNVTQAVPYLIVAQVRSDTNVNLNAIPLKTVLKAKLVVPNAV